jgi:anti-sigma regulatory factor (Ser/Thr protein kinase)
MHPYAKTNPPPAPTRPDAAPGLTVLPARTERTRPGPSKPDTSLILGPVETAPAAARATLKLSLKVWGLPHLADDAEAVASELVTNAVAASRDKAPLGTEPRHITFRLTVEPDSGELYIRVWDPDPTPPPLDLALPADEQESGRGLLIVGALSNRWGWHPGPNGGKSVWSALKLDAQPTTAPPEPHEKGPRR